MSSEDASGESLSDRSLSVSESAANPAASEIAAADRGSAGIDRVEALAEIRDRLKAIAEQRRFNRLASYAPYPKQHEFHLQGALHRERLFSAGNQLGKTWSGAAEAAYHATGLYPDWWPGRRIDRANTGFAGGISGELVREGPQRLLCGTPGDPEAFGSGMLPRECIVDSSPARGIPNLLDSVTVRHVSGGKSRILFKAYNQGRLAWQAQTVDWVWYDEEPPPEIYSEGMTRTNLSLGPNWLTFTPLQGMSQVAALFFIYPTPARALVKMTIYEAGHYTREQADAILASYPKHERQARGFGEPMLGSGAIFPVPEEVIVVADFPIPPYWPRIGGMDFGWDHPFAGVELAIDKDADVIYLTRCYRRAEAAALVHVEALRPWGRHLRWAWPHDGLQHDKGSGEQLADQFRKLGLKTLRERATFPDGTNGVEAGLAEMLGRMETGRWKVFASCVDWLEEYRTYHRKDGKIVKVGDDAISASRYAMMMRRHARPVPHDDVDLGSGVVAPDHGGDPFQW